MSADRLSAVVSGLFFSFAALGQGENRIQTRYLTEQERAEYLHFADDVGDWIWECRPDLAGFTDPPPASSRFLAESEKTQGVLHGWSPAGCYVPELTELLRESINTVETTVMVPAAYYDSARSCLSSRGFTPEDLELINWYLVPIEFDGRDTDLDIWIRDYGPQILWAPTGYQFVDMGYYSGPSVRDCAGFGGRPNTDVSPTHFASGIDVSTPTFIDGVDVFRPPLRALGGNLQTDGLGTCVHMRRDALAFNNFGGTHGWQYTEEQLDDVYRAFFNCERVIVLESFGPDPQFTIGQRGVIDYVDMFMTIVSPQTVTVAQLDPEDAAFDPVNAQIMDGNAQTLTDAGYNVVRIPQPRRYCTVHDPTTCIANPGLARLCSSSGSLDRVWATYANSIRIGNKMIVPVYHDVPEELADAIAAQEDKALTTYQATLDAEFGDGVVQVIPMVSDRVISCQASLHSLAMTY